MFNSNNNDNSMFWLILLLFMMAGNNNSPFDIPSTEMANNIFQDGIEKFLKANKETLDKAEYGDPIWQLNELNEAAKAIDNNETKAKVLSVAMQIMRKIDPNQNNCCCGGEQKCS